MYNRYLLLTFLLFSAVIRTQAQNNEPINFFYEIMKNDSLRMFFNNYKEFTDKTCAAYYRYVRVDDEGYFNSAFEDYTMPGHRIAGQGRYVHGKKDGDFILYDAKGTVSLRAHYQNNIPTGTWEYFNRDGILWKALQFNGTDTLVMTLADEQGALLVKDGNGRFRGAVQSPTPSPAYQFYAEGKLVNGKPDGKWSGMVNGKVARTERFKNGLFTGGHLPIGKGQFYEDRSYIKTFLLVSYYDQMEIFATRRCPQYTDGVPQLLPSPDFPNGKSADVPDKSYNFSMSSFSSELRHRIGNIIDSDLRMRRVESYDVGDHYLTVQFDLDANGKPEKFKHTTFWGNQFYSTISKTITQMASFHPETKTMYFHMKFTVSSGRMVQYGFMFSRDSSNPL